jgi:hypothetical protein
MLYQLLKSALKWVYNIFFDNNIADAEARLYENWFKEEVDNESL